MTSFDYAAARMAERDQQRTPKGWPRPRRANREGVVFPVAWITLAPDFASMDADRGKEALLLKLCQVCGEDHDPDGDVVIFLDGELRDAETLAKVEPGYDFPPPPYDATTLDGLVLKAKDGGMLHERCAKLALATCPHLRQAKDNGRLFAFAGPIAEVFIRSFEGRQSAGRQPEVYLPGNKSRVWLKP